MKQKLVWADEFDYEGPPDLTKWAYQTGGHGWGNNELQYYTSRTAPEDANAYVSGGRLKISLRREEFRGREYTSARIISLASWQYGRLDISARLPAGGGTWPAIWMLGSSISELDWPACGEIDIMEHVGRSQDVVHFSLHSKLYNHMEDTHLTKTCLYPGVSDGFHLYSVDWEQDRVCFLFDGKKAAVWRNGEGGRAAGPDGWPFNAPFFLIMNVAFGGFFGGAHDDSCLPQAMEIEYVRVYQ